MQMERCRNNRGTYDAGPHTFVGTNTTKNKYIEFYGIFKR